MRAGAIFRLVRDMAPCGMGGWGSFNEGGCGRGVMEVTGLARGRVGARVLRRSEEDLQGPTFPWLGKGYDAGTARWGVGSAGASSRARPMGICSGARRDSTAE